MEFRESIIELIRSGVKCNCRVLCPRQIYLTCASICFYAIATCTRLLAPFKECRCNCRADSYKIDSKRESAGGEALC
jgi:hypothetical protein